MNAIAVLEKFRNLAPPVPAPAVRAPAVWALITFGAVEDGMLCRLDPDLPAFVSRDTRGNAWGGRTYLTNSLRRAKTFRTRQACHRFLQRLDCVGVRPINLSRFGAGRLTGCQPGGMR